MSEPTFDFGHECKLYRGTAGEDAAAEVTGAIGLRWTDVKDKKETTRRASLGMRTYRAGLREVGIEFEHPWQPANADWEAFRAAYDTSAPLSIKILDAAEATGIIGDFEVEEFSSPQPLGEIVVTTIRLCPSELAGRVPENVG